MERATFEERLRAAARGAVQFTRDYFVRQRLPDEFAILVVPNCTANAYSFCLNFQGFHAALLPKSDSF